MAGRRNTPFPFSRDGLTTTPDSMTVPPILADKQQQEAVDQFREALAAMHAAGVPPEVVAAQIAAEVELTRDKTRRGIFRYLGNVLEMGKLLAIDPTSSRLPMLLTKYDADHELKKSILSHIDTEISTHTNLLGTMYGICEICFDRGVPPERVNDFFRCAEITKHLIESIYEQISLPAREEGMPEDQINQPDEASLAALEDSFKYFVEDYDPTSREVTMISFIKKTMVDFPYPWAAEWLNQKRNDFEAILKANISSIVDHCYAEIGRDNREKFIQLYLGRFFKYVKTGNEDYFELNMDELHQFFHQTLSKITTETVQLGDLRALLIDICTREIKNHYKLEQDDDMSKVRICFKQGEKSEFLYGDFFKDEIYRATDTADTFNGILVDPDYTPFRIFKHLKSWEDPNAYEAYLKVTYGAIQEDVRKIKTREKRACAEVNEMLVNIYNTAGLDPTLLPKFLVSPEVVQANNLLDLVKLAWTSDDSSVRFAARRKFELAEKMFFSNVPRVAFRTDDAARLQQKLVSLGSQGIEIDDEARPDILEVYHNPSTGEVIISESALRMKEFKKLPVDVCPAKFAGVEGYLMVTDYDYETVNFVNTKSLESIMMKLLRKPGSPEEMMDLVRITFIVKDPADMDKVVEKMDAYCGIGATVKIKGKYIKSPVLPRTYRPNAATSEEYRDKAAQFVVKNLVNDAEGQEYLVRFELRFGPPELLKEKDPDSSISHHEMKKRTAREVILNKLAPPVISTFKDTFYEKDRKGNHIFKRSVTTDTAPVPKIPQQS